MQVGDLVKELGYPDSLGLVIAEGMAASTGIVWWVLFGNQQVCCFEDGLEVISEGR